MKVYVVKEDDQGSGILVESTYFRLEHAQAAVGNSSHMKISESEIDFTPIFTSSTTKDRV